MIEHEIAHPELATCEVHGMTRSSFILRGALAAGAVYGTASVAPFVSQALAETGGGDVEILNFALTLEYLEADFYNVKGKQVGLSGQAKAYAKQFGAEEAEHVTALSAAIKQLGGKPVKKPTFVFPVTSESSFLALASVLENTGVGAYNGAGAIAPVKAGAGLGWQHRADRGAPRGGDRPAARQEPHSRPGLRQAAEQGRSARQGGSPDQGLSATIPALVVRARPGPRS